MGFIRKLCIFLIVKFIYSVSDQTELATPIMVNIVRVEPCRKAAHVGVTRSAAQVAEKVPTKEVAVKATPTPPHQHHVAVQAAPPPRHQHHVAVQAAPPIPVPLLHRQQQAVAVYDALCPDDEYLPVLGQLPRVTASRDRLDRDRERKKDLENFTKLLEDSLK